MSPKEKAEELVHFMKSCTIHDCMESYTKTLCPKPDEEYYKLFALIAVEEILQVLDSGRSKNLYTYIEQRNYWEQVKIEIEKL